MPRVVARLRARFSRIDPFDLFAVALIATVIVTTLCTFDQYAISNDEGVQQRYGELIAAYYASGFADQEVFHFGNLYLYGGLFDIVAVLIQHVIPFDPYFIRHILCALIGIGGIGATWATARLIAGPRAGAIAACALAVCGPWYGAMFNHTKDIPFAAAMIGAIYMLVRASRDLPRPRWRHVVGFGLLLGAALGQRVTGLIALSYVAVVIAIHMPHPLLADPRASATFARRSFTCFIPAFVIAYVLMIVAWPWAALAPLNPLRGLIDFSEFHYNIRTILAGQVYTMAEAPRWYVPIYLAIKLPLVMLLGAALALVFTVWRGSAVTPSWRREVAFLSFVGVFPVLCQVIAHGPAFTGFRHFLFVVPILAALAGVGLDAALTTLAARQRIVSLATATSLAAALLWNASVLVRLHPYEYLYFNPLVGGLEGANRRYITDYWVNIMPEAVDDLKAFLDRTDRDNKRAVTTYTVAVCGERIAFEQEADSRLRWVKDWRRADFFIAPTHMNCDRALDGKVIATIERLDVPIGVIKDRRTITRPNVAHSEATGGG